MKKILALLVIVPLAALGGIKGYAWYTVKQSMDEIVIALQPFATLTYGGVGASLTGRISVKDITIASPAIGAHLRIEELGISTPNLLTLLTLETDLRSDRIPDEMGLQIEHLRIPMEALARFEQNQDDADRFMDTAYALGCGDVERIGMAELAEMGYSDFDFSLDVSVERTGVSNMVKMVMDLNWHGGGSYTLTSRVPDARTVGQLLTSLEPPSLSFHLDSARYNSKQVAFCSRKAGVEPKTYVEQHVNLLRQRLADTGILLSDTLYGAYRKYLGEGETITISFNPTDMSSLQRINFYAPKDIPTVIGLEFHSGDELINYKIDWDTKKFRAALRGAPVEQAALKKQTTIGESDGEQPTARKRQAERPKKPALQPRGYVQVDKTTLGEYLNYLARVKTVTGRRFDGKLLRIEGTSIQLRVKFGGGAATLPIRLSDISSVQIFR